MSALDFVIYRARYAAVIAGLTSLALLTLLFYSSGALHAKVLPELFSSFEQLLGLVLLLILTPSFLLAFLITAQRRSMQFGQQVADSHLIQEQPQAWLQPIRARVPLLGMTIGLVYALTVNMPLVWLVGFPQLGFQVQSIVIGQVFLWVVVGLTFSYRLHTALSFNKVGKTVRRDVFDTSIYGPFAKNGLDDVFAITMLLALTTLQALDAQFRFENYMAAILVAIPGAIILFLLPMISVNRRLASHRADYLEEMNQQVSDASRQVTPDSIQHLELLLQHRDRIDRTRIWPINMSISARLAFYLIIPPLAWLGAAFVEFGLVRMLGDP